MAVVSMGDYASLSSPHALGISFTKRVLGWLLQWIDMMHPQHTNKWIIDGFQSVIQRLQPLLLFSLAQHHSTWAAVDKFILSYGTKSNPLLAAIYAKDWGRAICVIENGVELNSAIYPPLRIGLFDWPLWTIALICLIHHQFSNRDYVSDANRVARRIFRCIADSAREFSLTLAWWDNNSKLPQPVNLELDSVINILDLATSGLENGGDRHEVTTKRQGVKFSKIYQALMEGADIFLYSMCWKNRIYYFQFQLIGFPPQE
ncbi:uncharacterized protein F4822DRAFT_44835 [Hypoxylon trugodes]|uniref:uncharacterized protein n=1 Tax=Hypoxylon trugodes TaxID=326681 RepID=UPI00219A4D89|nr:uncharacterized protein F4822DRAFT_44835 [Hypoxylon trugodes]KAI1394303.1 hypothetical protein F4822DRAFT_44835 [Hypoxylon trugodes]